MSAISTLQPPPGYGYNDLGRDTLEDVYASVFHGESALVRPLAHERHTCPSCGPVRQPASRGRAFVACGQAPMTPWREVIGIRDSVGSLKEYGWSTARWTCLRAGSFDYEGIAAAINERTKTGDHTAFQRVRHPSHIVCEAIGELISFIKNNKTGRYLHGGQLLR